MATIKATFLRTGQVICPHTAVGVKVARENFGDTPMITLATAHPAKFPEAVKDASGQDAALPRRMRDLFDRPERVTRVANDLEALEALIRERTGR
jgi:threonine synthase